jgi:hypothetical protein
MKEKITDAMNTYNPALQEVIDLGYIVSLQDTDNDNYDWVALKKDCTLIAADPLRLLALVVIREKAGIDWNKRSIPDHYDMILEKHFNGGEL